MFRQWTLSAAGALLLSVAVAGVASSQTGPITGPGAVQPNPNAAQPVDKVSLQKLAEAHDADARIIKRDDGDYWYLFHQKINGVLHRVILIWSPAKNSVTVAVTVNQPLSREQGTAVSEQLQTWNDRLAPHTYSVSLIATNDSYLLLVEHDLHGTLSMEVVESELGRLLNNVAQSQDIWSAHR